MQSGTGFVQVSCAAGSRNNAREIASALVLQRLAACVHLLPIESHYRWQGELHEETEFLIQIKTTTGRLTEVESLIKRLHSYELPEISVMPIIGGSAEYLDWIADCVRPARTA
jgi:periplasmic divalent cation tolerance protein